MTENARYPPKDSAPTARSAWTFALCSTALLITIVFLGLAPHYVGVDTFGGNTDDIRAAQFTSGIGSASGPSEDLLYSNRLIGRALRHLYTANPNVPWYGVYLTVCHLFAHFLIILAWSRVSKDWRLRIAVVAFSLGIGSYCWTALQFTTTSALMALAGCSLIASSIIQEASSQSGKLRWPQIACGWGCVAFAGMIRWHLPLIVAVVVAPAMLGLVFLCWKRITAWKHLAIAALITSTMFGLQVSSERQWQSRPDWNEFKNFERPAANLINNRHATSLIFDHETPSDEVMADLDSVGWNHNDAMLFYNWLYFDETVFSIDTVSRANAALTSISVSWFTWFKAILASVRFFLTDGLSLILILLSLSVLTPQSAKIRTLGLLVWGVGALLSAYLYLFMKLPAHVVYPIASSAFFGTLFISAGSSRSFDSPRNINRMSVLFLAAALALAGFKTWKHYILVQDGVIRRAEIMKIVDQLAKGPDHLYVIVLRFPFQRVSPYDTMQPWKDWHFIYTDGYTRSPRYDAFLEKHGIDDLTKALYSDRRVKLITIESKMKMLQQFLKDHRGIDSDYSIVQDLTPIAVYQFHEKSSIWGN